MVKDNEAKFEEVYEAEPEQGLAVAGNAPSAVELSESASDVLVGKRAVDETTENAMVNAMTNPEQLDEFENKVVEFDNYIASDGVVEGDDGELIEGVRLILVDSKNGKAYSTFSPSFFRAFKILVKVKGTAAKWQKPIKIKIIKKKSQKNSSRKFLTFELV